MLLVVNGNKCHLSVPSTIHTESEIAGPKNLKMTGHSKVRALHPSLVDMPFREDDRIYAP
jgi:hypothetical protein